MSTSKHRSASKRKKSGTFAVSDYSSDRKSPGSQTPTSPAAVNSPLSNKVFSKEDEIRLLKALLQSTSEPNVSLPLGHFSETQIAAKIKRLKDRYHKLAKSKSRIKTAHDEEVYQIARLIWGKQAKKPPPLMVKISGNGEGSIAKEPSPKMEKLPDKEESEDNARNPLSEKEKCSDNGEEEDATGEVDLADFPYLVEQMAMNFTGNHIYVMGLKRLGSGKLKGMNEQWKVLMDEEAEFMAKKAQFYQEVEQLMTAFAFKN